MSDIFELLWRIRDKSVVVKFLLKWIGKIFEFYADGLIVTSLLLIIAMIATFMLEKKSKSVARMIWIFVLVRLLLPVSIELNTGIVKSDQLRLSSVFKEKEEDAYFASAFDGIEPVDYNLLGNKAYFAYYDMTEYGGDILGNLYGNDENNLSYTNASYENDNQTTDYGDDTERTNRNDNLDYTENKAYQKYDSDSSQHSGNSKRISTFEQRYITDTKNTSLQRLRYRLAIGWIGGVIIYTVYMIMSYLSLCRKKKYSVKLKGYDCDNAYIWPDHTGACIIGIFKPCIYLPSDMEEEDMRLILKHEQTHIRRKDHLFAILYTVALILNWFNPLCHLIYKIFRNDMEMACDEKVVKDLDVDSKRTYARLLTMQSQSKEYITAKAAVINFGDGVLKERIKHINKNYKAGKPLMTCVVLCCVAVLGLIAFNRQEKTYAYEVNDDIEALLHDDRQTVVIDDYVMIVEKSFYQKAPVYQNSLVSDSYNEEKYPAATLISDNTAERGFLVIAVSRYGHDMREEYFTTTVNPRYFAFGENARFRFGLNAYDSGYIGTKINVEKKKDKMYIYYEFETSMRTDGKVYIFDKATGLSPRVDPGIYTESEWMPKAKAFILTDWENQAATEKAETVIYNDIPSDIRYDAVSADDPDLVYFSDKRVIYRDTNGLYVYQLDEDQLIGYVPFDEYEEYHLSRTQGDCVPAIVANEDGSYVYITAYKDAENLKLAACFGYDVETGEVMMYPYHDEASFYQSENVHKFVKLDEDYDFYVQGRKELQRLSEQGIQPCNGLVYRKGGKQYYLKKTDVDGTDIGATMKLVFVIESEAGVEEYLL